MSLFVAFHRHGIEPLADFNRRLAEFALDPANPVVGVVPSVVGGVLGLSCTMPEDLLVMGPTVALLPVVVFIEAAQMPHIETLVGDQIEALEKQATEDDPRIPLQTTLHDAGGGAAYAVILVNVGVFDAGGEEPA